MGGLGGVNGLVRGEVLFVGGCMGYGLSVCLRVCVDVDICLRVEVCTCQPMGVVCTYTFIHVFVIMLILVYTCILIYKRRYLNMN